jgi:hypothetical protein
VKPALYGDGVVVRRRFTDRSIEIDFADLRDLAAGVVSPDLKSWAGAECAATRHDADAEGSTS